MDSPPTSMHCTTPQPHLQVHAREAGVELGGVQVPHEPAGPKATRGTPKVLLGLGVLFCLGHAYIM